MHRTHIPSSARGILLLCSLTVLLARSAAAGITDLASAPLATASTSSVLPNLLFVLDDSGSMDWDYLPDWVSGYYCRNSSGSWTALCSRADPPYRSSDFNTVYYNPAITYTPPLNADGSSKPNQTNWSAVDNDYYKIQSTSVSNLLTGFPDTEWCTSTSYADCLRNGNYLLPGTVGGKNYQTKHDTTASGSGKMATGTLTAPTTIVRSWGPHYYTMLPGEYCDNINFRRCQATQTAVYSLPAPLRWCSSAANAAATTPASGSCQAVKTATYATPRYPTIFLPGSTAFVRTDIVPGTSSYVYPGTNAKAITRTDCAGSTCTYTEEMTNFANWFAYYQTRMQMMKSSASIAFNAIGNRYRVGYFTINNYASSAHTLNIATFDATQKASWYGKLFAANPGGYTPLRNALAHAGRIFAGKLTSSPGGADPMQYSCQQNFTLLSTDGYWNSTAGTKIDGSSSVGNQDGSLPRPQYDGTGSSDTLADVAAYYYNTDLRTSALGNCTGAAVPPAVSGNDVCLNNVPTSGMDAAAHQHMTTFTLGLGIAGYMQYSPSYLTATAGDYFNVKNGSTVNAAAGVCTWQASGTCNWPVPASDAQSNIDDLWHAAVNGYGTYFSAGNPAALSAGLADALAGVSARTGDSAAATTSNPNIVTGDNFLFSSTYTSVDWYGELNRQQIDLSTGAVASINDWSAQSQLDNNSARIIYTYDPASSTRLKRFLWANLSSAEQNFFMTPAIGGLSQFCTVGVTCLSSAAKIDAAGAKLVAYLAGDRSLEGAPTDTSKYYNQRTHLLGDIVSSEAVYVNAPPFNYVDSGYAAFKASSRTGMAYVAANDGMLHAFRADFGTEAWAYIPSLTLANLYRLADKNYANLHSYQVDGTPTMGDVYDGASWRTLIVGGMNAGGRGYYALDVTDPAQPKALWEFTADISKGVGYTVDANLGYTFGKPEIAKLKNGTWVVFVTSGYNNVPDARYNTGNGLGYLYVLNAVTGALIRSIPTGVGSVGSPSGLAQVRAWSDDGMQNNTAQRVYGGDLLGNLWRFDVNGDIGAAGYDAQLLATLRGASANVQPITAKPELGDVNGAAVVYVGTGRYLGLSDLPDSSAQSIYAIKDALTSASYGNPRLAPSASGFVRQTLTMTTCPAGSPATICSAGQSVRTSTSLAVDMANQYGWYVDLPDSGERANTDPQLSLGTLAFTTNIPDSSACTIGGYSNVYFFDYRTGAPVSTSTTGVVGKKLGNALATRPVYARLPNNKVLGIVRLSDGTTVVPSVPIGSAASKTRRFSWRELQIAH